MSVHGLAAVVALASGFALAGPPAGVSPPPPIDDLLRFVSAKPESCPASAFSFDRERFCASYSKGVRAFMDDVDDFVTAGRDATLKPMKEWTVSPKGQYAFRSFRYGHDQLRVLCDEGLGKVTVNYDRRETREEPWSGIELPAGDGVVPQVLKHRVEPEMPERARKSRIGGQVHLMLLIAEDGSVKDVEVMWYHPPFYGFEYSAIEAALQWRFTPATKNGQPIASLHPLFMEFTVNP
jgi:TonB family protein